MKKFIKIIMKYPGAALSITKKYAVRILVDYYQNKGITLIFVNNSKSPEVSDLIRKIREETDMLLSDLDACQIYAMVKKTEKIEGDIAEVGVYKGGSAKLIREATSKPIHLFDTFKGLPDLCEHDDPEQFHKGDYSASLESVENYLKKYSNFYFYKGSFPSTAESVKNKIFSFVHLDVDIYESTLNCLKFFYPRMSGGGLS